MIKHKPVARIQVHQLTELVHQARTHRSTGFHYCHYTVEKYQNITKAKSGIDKCNIYSILRKN